MKTQRNFAIRAALASAASLVILVFAGEALAQRPIILDRGPVKSTRRAPRTISRGFSGPTAVAKPTNGILIVLTEPANAAISIDGKPAGSSDDKGEFKKELPGRKQYTVAVSAGKDYEPFSQKVALKAGQPEIIKAPLTSIYESKFAEIQIGPVLEGADIYIDDKKVENVRVDMEQNYFVVGNVPPGAHKVRFDHPDHVILEKDFPKVEAGTDYLWIFKPLLATVELTVRAEPGTSVFIDNVPKNKTPENGTVKVDDVKIGTHEIKLVKDGFEEQKLTREFIYGKPVAVEAKLVPLPSSAEFSDFFDFNLNGWTKPEAGWSVVKGKLVVEKAPQVGYATGINYRNISAMAFHLTMLNGGGAAWAVRVKDTNNYYLFYLSGPDGLYPGFFATYIVKDGKVDFSSPVNSVQVISNLKAGGEYDIVLKVDGPVITHTIRPADTGVEINLGAYKDKDNTFTYGGVGFRTVANEKYSIDDLFVQP